MTQQVVQAGYMPVTTPKEWLPVEYKGLQDWVGSKLRFTKKDVQNTEQTCSLFPHQQVTLNFLQSSSPYRSLLLYQGLGTGKTRASIAVAEALSTDYKIVVMVPASLEGNYIQEIKQCANRHFLLNGEWSFISKSNKDEFEKAANDAEILGVSKLTTKSLGGIWVRKNGKVTNYNTLKEADKKGIDDQLRDMIQARYNFVRYNGVRTESDAKKLVAKFDGFQKHIVIIDEVHNFVSKVVNNSKIISVLYNALLTCQSCKILLLSGTPIINKPIELAYICNLAKGKLTYFQCSLELDESEIVDKLKKHDWIDFIEVNDVAGVVDIIPLPVGFSWHDREKHLVKACDKYTSHGALIEEIKEICGDRGKIKIKSSLLLPDSEEVFNALFIDFQAAIKNANPVVNPMMLERRIQGLISHYEAYDIQQFPVLNETKYVKIEMPDQIYKEYMDVRQKEFELEMKNKKTGSQQAQKELTSPNYYRCLSRAMCNFMFPFARPRPASTKYLVQKEMTYDDEDADEVEGALEALEGKKVEDKAVQGKPKKASYDELIQEAIKKVITKGYFKTEAKMKEISPKFVSIYENIQNQEGTCILYSQFRKVEGLGLFKVYIESKGFRKLDITKQDGHWRLTTPADSLLQPKYVEFSSSGTEKEKNNMLLQMFNSNYDVLPQSLQNDLKNAPHNLDGKFAKILMITQSGAEGISCKNVRSVHIMEPFWNNVRIKQVIGRAVRAGSHLALPIDKRNVSVYMYMMAFSKKQQDSEIVKNREQGLTSDDYIFKVAEKKEAITNALNNIMKSASVDCMLYTHKHNNVVCTRVPKGFGQPKDVLYSYRSINDDVSDNVLKKQTKQVPKNRSIGVLENKRTRNRVYYLKDTYEILDEGLMYKNVYRIIGIIMDIDTKPKVVMYE
jgi:hypothetical protein